VGEAGNATNALMQQWQWPPVPVGEKIPQNAIAKARDASVAQSPAMKRKEEGYALRITGSGTDPLQLAQCAVEEADSSASERLNTHRLSCAGNTRSAKKHTSHAMAKGSFLLCSSTAPTELRNF